MSAPLFPLPLLIEIAMQAGEELMEIYDDRRLFSSTRLKKERSPFTIAEQKAEAFLVKTLQELSPSLPVIAEHLKPVSYNQRKGWEKFWMVDALHGTREFLKQTDEFTLNIALIEKGVPVTGLVYAPALKVLYAGNQEEGAFKIHKGKRSKIHCNTKPEFLAAVTNFFEYTADEAEKKEWKKYPIKNILQVGSNLKFCKIAEGTADIYYRSKPTREWETAAGEALIRASGGTVRHLHTKEFRYNKQMLKNKSFICVGPVSVLETEAKQSLTLG